jgi:hypothetical protein
VNPNLVMQKAHRAKGILHQPKISNTSTEMEIVNWQHQAANENSAPYSGKLHCCLSMINIRFVFGFNPIKMKNVL